MARSLPDSALAGARPTSTAATLRWPMLLQPYLLLSLLTALTLCGVYLVRPTVRIDMGGDFDSAFLRNFNGREIDADGAIERFSWAAGEPMLTLPGQRDGVWIATLRAADGVRPEQLTEAAVAVNDIRVDMPRRSADSILVKLPPELARAETLRFSLVSPLVGGAAPPRDIIGSIELAPARTYRWSRDDSAIVLPSLGRGAWNVSLGVVTAHPDGTALNAQLFANGRLLATLPDTAASRRIHLLVPAETTGGGDLELAIRSQTFNDPRPLGVFVSEAVVTPAGSSLVGTALPPLNVLGTSLVLVLGLYTCLALLGFNQRARRWPFSWALLATILTLMLGAWALAQYRFPSGFMLPRLAWLSLWSVLLLLALRPFTAWLLRVAKVPQPPAFVNLLLLCFFVSYWLKALGMLYPYFVAIDVHWHMTRAAWIWDGTLPTLYGTSSPLNESTMPTAEWGENRPVIPYSPYYHMFAAFFAFSPLGMDMTANMVSLLFDSTRIILIALLTLKAGLNARTALFAAATFAVLPVAFLLHSWGNVPTTMGLWLTMVATTFIVAFWERLHERWAIGLLSFGLCFTFLIYTVTGVFMGVYLLLFTLLVWLNARRGGTWRELQAGLKPLWLATGSAIAAALLLFYGQYIWPIIEQTVPYMGTVFTQGPQSVGVERPPFGQYMAAYIPHLDYHIWPGDYLYYGIAIPMLFTIPGYFALRDRPLIWITFSTWLTVAVLFMFAG
ncbi:hypothetical protein HC891_18505 [Candidatus Gracilibacteria bacterium]|nr:hypothetical protein [Candidatus Gracilibacteria bacterium]